uniref:Uncharacterized protein n=1 Tax=Erpetoichthys calabaricus TaxID=27687 RepID=A0A8C4SHJ7_ERPCA
MAITVPDRRGSPPSNAVNNNTCSSCFSRSNEVFKMPPSDCVCNFKLK